MDREQQLETILRMREAVERTKAAYDHAKLEVRHALELQSELGISRPDGNVSTALKHESESRQNYRRAVMEFNRCVLDAVLSDDEARPKTLRASPGTQI